MLAGTAKAFKASAEAITKLKSLDAAKNIVRNNENITPAGVSVV